MAYNKSLKKRSKVCSMCGKPYSSRNKPTVDHIIPSNVDFYLDERHNMYRGYLREQVNLVACCAKCNRAKSNRMPTLEEAKLLSNDPILMHNVYTALILNNENLDDYKFLSHDLFVKSAT